VRPVRTIVSQWGFVNDVIETTDKLIRVKVKVTVRSNI